jgi:hypothetical protein
MQRWLVDAENAVNRINVGQYVAPPLAPDVEKLANTLRVWEGYGAQTI